jgi:hypothetical protein
LFSHQLISFIANVRFDHRIDGRTHPAVFDQIAQRRFPISPDRRFERNRIAERLRGRMVDFDDPKTVCEIRPAKCKGVQSGSHDHVLRGSALDRVEQAFLDISATWQHEWLRLRQREFRGRRRRRRPDMRANSGFNARTPLALASSKTATSVADSNDLAIGSVKMRGSGPAEWHARIAATSTAVILRLSASMGVSPV